MLWRLTLCAGLVAALMAGATTGTAAVGGPAARAGAGLVPRAPRPAAYGVDPRTILVGFTAPANAREAVVKAGDRPLGLIPGARVEVVRLQTGETLARKLAEYRARPDVVFAEPNYVLRPESAPALTPNDPRLGEQWALSNMDAPQAWAVYPGSFAPGGGARIAVVDTGVYAGHPDLAGKVLAADGAGCLGSGFVCSPVFSSADDLGHGTHVAGIAAAIADNGTGVAGLAVSSPVIPIKVCFTELNGGGCPVASVASGIAWAVSKGARVINVSLGGPSSGTVCAAVKNAIAHGVVVVAAAGNAGSKKPSYPAACPGAIGVAANSVDTDTAYYSNFDYPNVFVSAPGGGAGLSVLLAGFEPPDDPGANDSSFQVLSTVPFNMGDQSAALYESVEGTSMAAPYVSGLAALLVSQRPLRTPTDVRRVLAKTADKVGESFGPSVGADPYYGVPYGGYTPRGPDPFKACAPRECTWHPFWGYGQIDAAAALSGAAPRVLSFTPASGPVGTAVTVSGEDLATATSVSFGPGSTSTILAAPSENTVQAAVPETASTGPVAVTTPSGRSTGASSFKVMPRIDSVTPSPAIRSQDVVVSGFTFDGATSVKFGGLSAVFHVDSSTQITAKVPAAAVSSKVTVTTPSGSGTSAQAVPVALPPKVSGFSPASGPIGSVVKVTGQSLDAVASAKLGDVDVGALTHLSATQLSFTVPPTAATGKIAVTGPAGTSASLLSFKVSPTVSGFSPPAVSRGDSLTIGGASFTSTGTPTTVKIGSAPAPITVQSDTELTVTVPATAVSGRVTVTTSAGSGSSTASLVVIQPSTVTGFSPRSGPVGSVVKVTGRSLDAVTSATLGGVDVGTLTHPSSTQLSFTVPPGAVGGPVVVTVPDGSVAGPGSFQVTPKIDGFTPAAAIRTGTVVVHGSSFFEPVTVKVGAVPATAVHDSDSQLTVTVPTGAMSGKLSVTTPSGTATSAAAFTVILPPTISGFSPASGQPGTTVTVSGTNLSTVTTVLLGGVDAGAITHVGAGQIKVVVPAGAATGTITVTNPAGSATKGTFTVPFAITSFEPAAGAPGTTVTIHGSGLQNAALVEFAGAPAFPTSISSGTVTAAVPAGATDGAVSVVAAGGSRTVSEQPFLVTRVTSFAPGISAPGGTVTISGAHLGGVTAVDIGFAPAASFHVVDPSTVTAVVPAGAVDGPIRVHSGNGVAETDRSLAIVRITNILTETAKPGSTVTITGVHLETATAVRFGGAAGTSVTPDPSGDSVTAVVPPAAVTGPVEVDTAYGTATSPMTLGILAAIQSLSPDGGFPGTSVTITGGGFRDATAVYFTGSGGLAQAAITSRSDDGTSITVVEPATAMDGATIVVTHGGQSWSWPYIGFCSAASDGCFHVPSISNPSPGSAPPGVIVTFYGRSLGHVKSVKFGDVPTRYFTDFPSGTGVLAAVPDLPPGPVTVTIETGWGTVTTQFTVSARTTARVVLNEINPNLGENDLIEFRVVEGGSLSQMTINDLGVPVLIGGFPSLTVAAGDLVVVHMYAPFTLTESTSKMQCTDPVCYPGAWDVTTGNGMGVGVNFGNTVVTVAYPSGIVEDSVAAVRPDAGMPTGFLDQLHTVQASHDWLPANCGGASCTYDTTPSAVNVSADWSGVGSTPTGMSLQRTGATDTDTAADWTVAPETFGLPN